MDANEQIAQFLGYAAIIAVVAWIISFGIRSAHKQEKAEQDKINSGPGRFRIIGVSRKTSEDCALEVEAASPDNAKAKADLSGMIVTRVERI